MLYTDYSTLTLGCLYSLSIFTYTHSLLLTLVLGIEEIQQMFIILMCMYRDMLQVVTIGCLSVCMLCRGHPRQKREEEPRSCNSVVIICVIWVLDGSFGLYIHVFRLYQTWCILGDGSGIAVMPSVHILVVCITIDVCLVMFMGPHETLSYYVVIGLCRNPGQGYQKSQNSVG